MSAGADDVSMTFSNCHLVSRVARDKFSCCDVWIEEV